MRHGIGVGSAGGQTVSIRCWKISCLNSMRALRFCMMRTPAGVRPGVSLATSLLIEGNQDLLPGPVMID
jgi:hypothetical protein